MPITRPWAASSGPPELPRLIAASVWIAPPIWKPVSESIDRLVADTTPTDSDCSSPNGEPIAATGSPTPPRPQAPDAGARRRPHRRPRRVAERQRAQLDVAGVDLDEPDVGVGVEAHHLGVHAVAVGE